MLSVGFLGIGMLQVVGLEQIALQFKFWNLSPFIMYGVGLLEVIGSVMLFYFPTRLYGGLLLLLTMLAAIAIHLQHKEYSNAIVPLTISVFTACLIVLDFKILPRLKK